MRGWSWTSMVDLPGTLGRGLVVAVKLLALVPHLVVGQSVVVDDCVNCELKATLRLQIGTIDGPGALGAPARITHRQNGQWVITDFQEPSRLRIFSSDGEWVRTVGRPGQGPGEYDLALWVSATEGDSLKVADIGQSRITTLTAALAPLRTQLMGRAFNEIVFLEDGTGRYVISARAPVQGAGNSPIHLVAGDGSVIRSFDSEPAIANQRAALGSWRNIAITRAGKLWSAKVTSYELRHWSLETGELLQVLERDADWFPPESSYATGYLDRNQEPAPGLLDIYADSTGIVWTGSHVADTDWRAAFEEGKGPYGRPTQRVHDLSRYYDTVIEAISPVDQRVIGRIRLKGTILNFVGDGLVATWELEPPGYPVVQVWGIELPGARTRR